MSKKPAPFNNPFIGLKLKKEEPKKPAPPVVAPRKQPSPEEDEGALFRATVGAVDQVRKGPGRVTGGPPPSDLVRIQSEDEEVLEHLALLVGGTGQFDLADSDEFIEGAITGLDRRIVQKLRRGEYAVQAHLDLHGMVRAEAKAALERFVLSSRRAGKRCVLIVHGRGLHSRDQIPVLKESVQVWLSRGRIAREVIAFATARPHDGGAGALYVLLRR
ncbi:MAG: Smr/MutS family protein [Myxococcaceae bacterium]|nr:Smr/MutS family protein [Myxococcaceae bacterium]